MQSLFCTSHSCLPHSNIHSSMRFIVVAVLSIALTATGCSAQWMNVALSDFPR